jgi:hypothetical protein
MTYFENGQILIWSLVIGFSRREQKTKTFFISSLLSQFFFGKLTYVLKEEDTKIIRGIPQIYNENRNIKQQMATG